MTKFDMNSAWNDAMQLLRADIALTSVIVGLLIMLPSLAFALIGPEPVPPAPSADPMAAFAALAEQMSQIMPILLGMALLQFIATIAVLRLWLAPTGISVGEALAFAAASIPAVLVIFVIQMFALGFAAILLLLPAIYMPGRWATTMGVLAAGDTRNPVEALSQSWKMTQSNGWCVALMLVLVQIVIIILTMLIDGVGGLLGARGSIGYALASLVSSAFAAGAALVGFAVSAAIYRQLSQRTVARSFE